MTVSSLGEAMRRYKAAATMQRVSARAHIRKESARIAWLDAAEKARGAR